MAPPPEYDKEPKAPDKSATTITNEDSKIMNSLNDQQTNSDHKITTTANSEAEKKVEDSVENLDDGRLRALLDEAITYKCPKDREGKSDLFKNLLEEAEQDDQATEAAARGSSSGAGRARRAAGRRALAHSNSLQDLVAAALAAEPAPRRPRPHAPVSARATHGGSLPSGVDTSFLLGEEPTRAGYLATVRCVNPPPLAERRVSASDANCPAEVELLHRRSKPVFPMTYTARATLEIGSGSVSSGRAVTTTTASNQVRNPRSKHPPHHPPADANQSKLMSALHRTIRVSDNPSARKSDPRGPQRHLEQYGISWGEITARYSPENATARCLPENATSLCPSNNKKEETNCPKKKVTPRCSPETATAIETKCPKNIMSATNTLETAKTRCLPENATSLCPSNNKKEGTNCPKKKVIPRCSPETATAIKTKCPKNKMSATNTLETAKTRCSPENATSLCPPKNKSAMKNCPKNNVIASHSPHTVTARCSSENATSRSGSKIKTAATNYPKNKVTASCGLETSMVQKSPLNETSRCPPKNKTAASICSKNKVTPRNSPENATLIGPSQNTTAQCFQATASYTRENVRSLPVRNYPDSDLWMNSVDRWYQSLTVCHPLVQQTHTIIPPQQESCSYRKPKQNVNNIIPPTKETLYCYTNENKRSVKINPNVETKIYNPNDSAYGLPQASTSNMNHLIPTSLKYEAPIVNKAVEYGSNEYFKLCDNVSDNEESEIILRKEYRKRVGHNLEVPSLSLINPRNIRPMTIGSIPPPVDESPVRIPTNKKNAKHIDIKSVKTNFNDQNLLMKKTECDTSERRSVSNADDNSSLKCDDSSKFVKINENNNKTTAKNLISDALNKSPSLEITNNPIISKIQQTVKETNIELVEVSKCGKSDRQNSFLQYYEDQQKLFQVLEEAGNTHEETELVEIVSDRKQQDNNHSFVQYYKNQQNLLEALKETHEDDANEEQLKTEKRKTPKYTSNEKYSEQQNDSNDVEDQESSSSAICLTHNDAEDTTTNGIIVKLTEKPQEEVPSDQLVLSQLPNNAYVFLTMPQRLFTPLSLHNKDKKYVQIEEIQNDASDSVEIQSDNKVPKRSKKKKDKTVALLTDAKKKENLNKTTLKVLLFEKLKRDSAKAASSDSTKEGDSAIPFSCITTPEVVSSCNTTSSIAQSAVAVDPKPRSVISSSFNGLSLTRPNYGSTATAATDDYKKSLDENGNAVQGFSSPISGSSQHKKPRRKKSSKNETVIKSHQIDGYQGNKDLNEVLRFIESNAEHGRGAKLPRAKHKDDDDKGKKRPAERRKDKDKLQRASSLEERSRTTLADLTDARPTPPDAKPERRSWGTDARDAYYYEPEPAPELTEFQTVTKRRKPRRRADDGEREPPRRPRPPSPRPRRESAPPSERSNDSNDDQDSVHSLPPPPPPPAHHASYADIARTRHNIPDLIESCNFYAEGEPPPAHAPAAPDAADAADAADADGYPALGDARLTRKPPPRRKERAPPAPADSPAPDVLGDRRPAVILLDEAARPRDMDGVTFGFDINEQLLVSGARRPRCDLVRDAIDIAAGTPVAAGGGGGGGGGGSGGAGGGGGAGVAVVAGCAALRYLVPEPPPNTHHLHQIIDYVGNAWEDVVRCGNGKVRYFSE